MLEQSLRAKLLRLCDGGIAGFPPWDLPTLAQDCRDVGRLTGDGLCFMLAECIDVIAGGFTDGEGGAVTPQRLDALDLAVQRHALGVTLSGEGAIAAVHLLREDLLAALRSTPEP